MKPSLFLFIAIVTFMPSALASSIGPCKEYVEAKDAKERALLLHKQQGDEASSEIAQEGGCTMEASAEGCNY